MGSSPSPCFILQRKCADSTDSNHAACCNWLCTKWKQSAQHTESRHVCPAHTVPCLQMPAKLCLTPQNWALCSVRCSRCTGADDHWRTWEDHNLWPGRIKEFWHPPTCLLYFSTSQPTEGKKIKSRWLWVCDTQPGSCREINGKRNSIWLQWDGEGPWFTAGDIRQKIASEIFTAPAFQRDCALRFQLHF